MQHKKNQNLQRKAIALTKKYLKYNIMSISKMWKGATENSESYGNLYTLIL